MYLILGLGNPGPRYELTRHNIGFLVVDSLTEKHRIDLSAHRHHAVCGEGRICGCRVLVAKPLTYMNESGKAARAILHACHIPPGNVIVVHDDIDLPLGTLKIKHKGGDAGQRGIRSLIETLEIDAFARIRVGIGRPQGRGDVSDYVLSNFSEEEQAPLNDIIEKAIVAIEQTLHEFNKRDRG